VCVDNLLQHGWGGVIVSSGGGGGDDLLPRVCVCVVISSSDTRAAGVACGRQVCVHACVCARARVRACVCFGTAGYDVLQGEGLP
jgi:hypothetical protein